MAYRTTAEERLRQIDMKIEEINAVIQELKKEKTINLSKLNEKEHQLLQNKIRRADVKRDLRKDGRRKRAHRLIQVGSEVARYVKVMDFTSDEDWDKFLAAWKRYVDKYHTVIQQLR